LSGPCIGWANSYSDTAHLRDEHTEDGDWIPAPRFRGDKFTPAKAAAAVIPHDVTAKAYSVLAFKVSVFEYMGVWLLELQLRKKRI
jgi:hypothetical protein